MERALNVATESKLTLRPLPDGAERKGLVVLDVDGVVFRGHFMVELARRRGRWVAAQTAVDCLLFEAGRMPLERLLRQSFERVRGLRWGKAEAAYRAMPMMPNAAETVRELRARGMHVVLLTVGAPDALVKDLARRLDADDGAGICLPLHESRLAGAPHGASATAAGKVDCVQRLIEREGIAWSDVVAVGDDRNNLPLMQQAGRAIGFRATGSVRRRTRHLVDREDLAALLPAIFPKDDAALRLQAASRGPWHREIVRKLLHMTAAFAPFFLTRWPAVSSGVLVAAMALYLLTEFIRMNGTPAPLVGGLNRLVMRRRERRGPVWAPLTLALGVLGAFWLLPRPVDLACILIIAIGDSAASVIGTRWGARRWPHNPSKTFLGSAAFLGSAVACALVYLPLPQALLLASLAAAIESLPLEEWDNFLTPVGAGMVTAVLGAGL